MKLNIDLILGSIMYSIIAIFVLCCICHTPKSEKPVNRVHFYVARDKNGSLWLYIGKPFRDDIIFRSNADKKVFCLSYNIEEYGLKYEDYDYLKWEDEPVEVFLNLEN